MRNNPDSHELLAVVAAVHHERVGQALDDRAVGLPEPLDSIFAGRVRNVDRCSDLDVVAVKRPLVACACKSESSFLLRPSSRLAAQNLEV